MSELNEDVVFRICDTRVSMIQGEALTVVKQERLSDWTSHRPRPAFQEDQQRAEHIGYLLASSGSTKAR